MNPGITKDNVLLLTWKANELTPVASAAAPSPIAAVPSWPPAPAPGAAQGRPADCLGRLHKLLEPARCCCGPLSAPSKYGLTVLRCSSACADLLQSPASACVRPITPAAASEWPIQDLPAEARRGWGRTGEEPLLDGAISTAAAAPSSIGSPASIVQHNTKTHDEHASASSEIQQPGPLDK